MRTMPLSATLLLLASGSLLAAAERGETPAPVITVTGEQIERDRQDTITSTSVVTGDDLSDMAGSPVLDEVLRKQANVAVTDGQFIVRGMSNYEGENVAPLISVIQDGAWVSPDQNRRGWAPLHLWDIEQIEILRGPQSTERGANSVGGAIVIRTADPTFHHTGRARALYGEYDTMQVAAAHGGPILKDVLAFRLAADYQGSSGYLEDADGRDDYGENRAITGRGKLLWQPLGTDALWIKFTAEYVDATSNNQNVEIFSADAEDRRPEDAFVGSPNPDFASNTFSGIIDVGWKLGERQELTSTTAYNQYQTEADYSGNPILAPTAWKYYDTALTEEVKLTHTGESVVAVGGLYLGRFTDGFEDYREPGGNVTDLDQDTVRTSLALFASADWTFAPRWIATGGVRVERAAFESEYERSVNSVVTTNEDDSSDVVVLPRAGVRWEFIDDVSVGGQVSRGFRGGGVSYSYTNFQGFTEYDPEYVWNYELALRSRMLDRQVTANLNLFFMDWTDKQVSVFQGVGLPNATENAGEATSYGAELDLSYRPQVVPGLWLASTAGIIRTEYDDYVISPTVDNTGNEFPSTPEYTLSASAGYRHASGAFASAEVVRIGSAYEGADNTRQTMGYNTINARVGYAWEMLELAVFGTNLSDEFALVRNGAFYQVPNAPRVLGVSLDARW